VNGPLTPLLVFSPTTWPKGQIGRMRLVDDDQPFLQFITIDEKHQQRRNKAA
jgi:hypothetical protein